MEPTPLQGPPNGPDLDDPANLRQLRLRALAEREFDVLVIGGGITGAGVARDAAMRGLRVALVEKDDFASGTSSRSSRLVHGGVRYLEHGQLHLVFESSRERATLLQIAPNLVRPLEFTWPVFRGARVPRWKLSIGLGLYDALSLFRNVERHRRLSARRVVERERALRNDDLRGGATYWDAATNDSRLTLATALSAERSGGVVANHVRVTAMARDGDDVMRATVCDQLTATSFDVRASVIVNATGPWSDDVAAMTGVARGDAVQGSKGVHVCVRRDRVGNTGALTLLAPQDGRVMFVLPAGEFTIIGTTDTFENVSPDEVRANEGDITYLLEAANYYFPDAQLIRDDVVSAWAGLRPLVASKAAGEAPGSVSREHAIDTSIPGMVRVTGGKLTTYRSMAEEIVDVLQDTLGLARSPCTTADVVLEDDACPDGADLLVRADHSVRKEHAHTLGDILIRRMSVAFETRDHGLAAAHEILPAVSSLLGWDEGACACALDDYRAEIARIFAVEKGD